MLPLQGTILIYAICASIRSEHLQVVDLLDRGTGNQALVPGPVVGVLGLGIESSSLELLAKEAVGNKLPGNKA